MFATIAYRVRHFNRPSLPRPELKEALAPHHDMLRYDLGFHHPAEPDLIILPIFNFKSRGRMRSTITTRS